MFGYTGVAMYIFDGNTVLLNIYSECKKKKDYKFILVTASYLCIILFIAVGTFGSYTFRD